MTADQKESFGWGDGLTATSALRRAYAEAWERLVIQWISTQVDASSSNGFAAGPNVNLATQAATNEWNERACVLHAWREQRGWNSTTIKNPLARILHRLVLSHGWRVDYYLVQSKLNLSETATENTVTCLCGVAFHEELGIVFDSVVQDQSPWAVETKLIRSLIRQISIQTGRIIDLNWHMPFSGHPNDHANYYRNPSRSLAFAFMKQATAKAALTGEIDAPKINFLLPHTPVVPAVAYVRGSPQDELHWGTQSIRGINSFPHPIA